MSEVLETNFPFVNESTTGKIASSQVSCVISTRKLTQDVPFCP